MRTVWSDENIQGTEGYWKIFADPPTSLLERAGVPHYRLDHHFDVEDGDLPEQLVDHLNQAIEKDASYTKKNIDFVT